MSKRKFQIDWLNHILEFIVVLIGILIAFQLNQYSTDRQNERTIDTHLQEIEKETQFNKVSLERAISYAQQNLLKLDTTIMLIKEQSNYEDVNRLSLELLSMGGVYLRKNAFVGLIESGDIRFMNNFEEKQKIINLYEYYKWVESFDEISNTLYTEDFYPYMRENFDLLDGVKQENRVYNSKIFKNILGAYSTTSKNRVTKYQDCLKQIEAYLEQRSKG